MSRPLPRQHWHSRSETAGPGHISEQERERERERDNMKILNADKRDKGAGLDPPRTCELMRWDSGRRQGPHQHYCMRRIITLFFFLWAISLLLPLASNLATCPTLKSSLSAAGPTGMLVPEEGPLHPNNSASANLP